MFLLFLGNFIFLPFARIFASRPLKVEEDLCSMLVLHAAKGIGVPISDVYCPKLLLDFWRPFLRCSQFASIFVEFLKVKRLINPQKTPP